MEAGTQEPLAFFFDKYGYDDHAVQKIVTGKRYSAVMRKDGRIGVCATLGHPVSPVVHAFRDNGPDLTDVCHRILFTAYLNAGLNYRSSESPAGDIWDVIDFSKKKNIVMVGLFKPIVQKFERHGVPLEIFDMRKADGVLTDMAHQKERLSVAQAVILTATSVFNETFMQTLTATPEQCRIYLLGPSAIMAPEMLAYRNIKMIFGATFERNDERVLSVIENNGGTKQFLKFGAKNTLKA